MDRLSYMYIEGVKYPLCHCLRSEELIEEIWGSREALFDAFNSGEVGKISNLKNLAKGLVVMNNAAVDYIELFNPPVDKEVSMEKLTDTHLLTHFSSQDGLYLMETYIAAIGAGTSKSTEVEDGEKNKERPQT